MTQDQKTWASVFGIILVLAICTILIATDVLNYIALIPVAFGCIPMVKNINTAIKDERVKALPRVRKALKKLNVNIDRENYDEERGVTTIQCYYREKHYVFQIEDDASVIWINYDPFGLVEADDPRIPNLMEAINETNEARPHTSVCLTQPDEEGRRLIYARAFTTIPTIEPVCFIEWMMFELVRTAEALNSYVRKDYSWKKPERDPIGFATEKKEKGEDSEAKGEPTAKTRSRIGFV